jgi:hypothetical protein
MSLRSCNCIVCANEFNPDELHNVALSKINITSFKICEACLNMSDPSEDYREAREIVYSYLKFAKAKHIFSEVQDIINSVKKQ